MNETTERSNSLPLTRADVVVRLMAIGLVMLAIGAAFAYVGGWLSPSRLTQARLMTAFEAASGEHPGFRRNHAKGLCVTGWFEGSGDAAPLSAASVFRPGKIPVVGRFALAGGMPAQPDANTTVRSMALRFLVPGAEWRTGMNNIPVFSVNSAQGFYDQLLASKPDPATGKPNAAAMKTFLSLHPEAGPSGVLIRARVISSGFADSTFNSLNAFRLVDAAGRSTPVRWAAVPVPGVGGAPSGTAGGAVPHGESGKNYLFDQLIAQIRTRSLQWHLVLTLAEPGDPINDASLPWPAQRRHVDAGVVTIDKVSSEDTGACTDINYDPLVLPPGIEPSDDPLLSARSSAYARSFTLRTSEEARRTPSAVGSKDVDNHQGADERREAAASPRAALDPPGSLQGAAQ